VPTTTLVSDVYVSKAEALDALAELFRVAIDSTDPSNAVLVLENDVVVSIEVPKFGEDLPLTLDLTGKTSGDVQAVTARVMDQVAHGLSWTLTVVGSS
jgi:hypothetical protein